MLDPTMKSRIARYLVDAGRVAPSADNSQPFQFVWSGDELAISYSTERGSKGIFDAKSHASLLSLGGVIENIDQAAMAESLELHWQPLNLGGGPLVRVTFVGHSTFEGLHDGHPLFKRHTNRFPFAKRPMPQNILLDFDAKTLDAARVKVISPGDKHIKLVRCVRVAAEARFCNKELHHWLMGSIRFSSEAVSRGDGLDISTLNMPPGGALFMKLIANWDRMVLLNRLGLYKLLALTETQLLGAAPAIICIVGKFGADNTVQSGRLLAKAWIELNNLGFAVHPYYVITDQLLRLENKAVPHHMEKKIAEIRDFLPELLGLASGEGIHMLLRVGFSKGEVPRSRRLPLEKVFTDLS